jgi:hypothetical protein
MMDSSSSVTPHATGGTGFAPPSEPGFLKKQSSLLFKNTLRIPLYPKKTNLKSTTGVHLNLICWG